MRRLRTWIAALPLLSVAACAPNPSSDELHAQFMEAERLCLDGQFSDAQPLLKQYLLHRPEDAGAHYYLGRVFMMSEDFRPVMAEGEFQTALRLFASNGRTSPIDRFDPDYFEMICNIDSAKILYIQCVNILTLTESPAAVQPVLERALDYIDRARAIKPNAAEIGQIGDPIRELATRLGLT